MEMPVIVGLLIAVMFVVGLSQWFYGLIKGFGELVLDDVYFGYRIFGTTVISILFMVGVFWGVATINECKEETREGIFASLKCEEYLSLKAATEGLFNSK